MTADTITHMFVDTIPDELDDDVVYVSVEYATAVHTCCCGCGQEVVTPLSPTDWKLIYDGDTISLSPSIGNWSFDCRSHYVIRNNRVRWARDWSPAEVDAGRRRDREAKSRHYAPQEHELDLDRGLEPWITRLRRHVSNWWSNLVDS